MNKNLLIRLAEAEDLQQILHIRCEVILALAPVEMSMPDAHAWAERPDRPARTMSSIQAKTLWVAGVNEEIVGWVEVGKDSVDGRYVAPGYSGKGFGTALMARAERHILDSGYSAARLNATANARGFYLRQGFQQTGPTRRVMGLPWSSPSAMLNT